MTPTLLSEASLAKQDVSSPIQVYCLPLVKVKVAPHECNAAALPEGGAHAQERQWFFSPGKLEVSDPCNIPFQQGLFLQGINTHVGPKGLTKAEGNEHCRNQGSEWAHSSVNKERK